MTERFEIFPQNVAKDGTLIIIQKGLKLYNISDVVDLLNKLIKENKDLEEARSYYQENFLTMKTERNQLKKENKELKKEVYGEMNDRE